MFTVARPKKTHRTTDCSRMRQPRRKMSRRNACAHDRRSVSHWWDQSASSNWLKIDTFHSYRSLNQHSWGVLSSVNSFCRHTSICQASSSFSAG